MEQDVPVGGPPILVSWDPVAVLPDNVLSAIFGHVEFDDIASFSNVSQSWRWAQPVVQHFKTAYLALDNVDATERASLLLAEAAGKTPDWRSACRRGSFGGRG